MKTYETGICRWCGKKKEEHFEYLNAPSECISDEFIPLNTSFLDSGLHLIRENAIEVLRAAEELVRHRKEYGFRSDQTLRMWEDEHLQKFATLEAALRKSLPDKEKS